MDSFCDTVSSLYLNLQSILFYVRETSDVFLHRCPYNLPVIVYHIVVKYDSNCCAYLHYRNYDNYPPWRFYRKQWKKVSNQDKNFVRKNNNVIFVMQGCKVAFCTECRRWPISEQNMVKEQNPEHGNANTSCISFYSREPTHNFGSALRLVWLVNSVFLIILLVLNSAFYQLRLNLVSESYIA